MSDKDLGTKLLDLDAAALAGVPQAHRETWSILARDRRRVRFWAILALLVWLLAAVMVFGGLAGYAVMFPEQSLHVRDLQSGKLAPAEREAIQFSLLLGFQKGTLLIAFSVAVLALFSLVAVFLILASRRATLRQVNASLVEIAEQLKRLRAPGGTAGQ